MAKLEGGHRTLFKLPRELRDLIYDDLLSAGSLAILRTSKSVNHEVSERLFRKAICRMYFGSPQISPIASDRYISQDLANRIQNIGIYVKWPKSIFGDPGYDFLMRFLGSGVPRKSCVFTIQSYLRGPSTKIHPALLYHREMTGFEEVVFMFDFLDCSEHPDYSGRGVLLHQAHVQLGPYLGPVSYRIVGDEEQMVYHPLKNHIKITEGLLGEQDQQLNDEDAAEPPWWQGTKYDGIILR